MLEVFGSDFLINFPGRSEEVKGGRGGGEEVKGGDIVPSIREGCNINSAKSAGEYLPNWVEWGHSLTPSCTAALLTFLRKTRARNMIKSGVSALHGWGTSHQMSLLNVRQVEVGAGTSIRT